MIHFYNAGAGSGKTHQLTADLVKFLTEGKGSPRQVILTTFTVKAAEELKERVRQALLRSGEAAKAAEMSNALIGTVNSICSTLVETYALEAGLTPGLRVLDEMAVNIFFQEFIASHLTDDTYQQFSVLSSRFDLYEENDYHGKDRMKPQWPAIVKSLAEKFRSYGLVTRSGILPSLEKSLQLIDQLITSRNIRKEALIEKARHCFPFAKLAKEKTPKSGMDDMNFILSSFLSRQDENDFTWYEWVKIGKMKFSNKLVNEFPKLGELITIMQAFHQLPEFKAEWKAITELLYETAISLLEAYQQYKQERGLIDFADQEYLLLQMLDKHPLIREEIRSGFKIIMVDELQDSSPLQIAIFSRLQEIIDTSIWVGDPKQSIYGFRGADADLFMDTMKEVEKQSEIRELSTSRRSRPELVQVVNAIFTGLFQNMLPENRIRLEPWDLIAGREPLYNSAALHLYFFETQKMEDYFKALAWKIKELLNSGIMVYNKENEGVEKLQAGDIALLFRGNEDITKMAKALTNLGISVAVETAGFDQKAEVQWIKNLLRLLINPKDSLAIANVMLMEGAVEDVESLIEHRLKQMEDEKYEEIWPELSPTSKRIIEGRKLVDHMPLLQTIEYLITISDLPVYCARWGDYASRMATISHLLTLSAKYEEESAVLGIAASYAGFLSYLGSNTGMPPTHSKDAVNLMTVHGAKGLEWPMVIAAKMNLESNDCRITFNQVHVRQTHPFDLSNPLKGRQIIYLPWPFGLSKNVPVALDGVYQGIAGELGAEKKFLEEEDRLLYVALTRARDYLLLTGDEKCASYASLFEGSRNERTRLFNSKEWTTLQSKVKTGESKSIEWKGLNIFLERPALKDQPADLVKETGREPNTVFYYDLGPLTSNAAHARRYISPSRLQHETNEKREPVYVTVMDYNGKAVPVTVDKNISYDTIGTIIHTAFAAWNPEAKAIAREDVVKQVLKNFQAETSISAATLEAQFASFWQYIESTYKPTRYWKEIPVQSVAANHAEIMSGFADLLLETAEGLVLIDHKTFPGSFEAQVLNRESEFYAGRYAAQLNAYADLISKTFGKEVKQILIHYVINGKLVSFSAPPFAPSAPSRLG